MSEVPELKRQTTRLKRYYRIVLLVAGSEVPLNKYMIWKALGDKTGESEPTILYAIKDLEEWGFIRRVTTEKRARGGEKSYHYELTRVGLEGLIPIVSGRDEERFFGNFATKYRRFLPGICNLLPIFERAGAGGIARRRLRLFSTHFHGDPLLNYVYDRLRDKRPFFYGEHGLKRDEKEYANGHFYRCTDQEDTEDFVNPLGIYRFSYYKGADQDQKKWLEIVRSNELLLAATIGAGLREARSHADRAHNVMTDLHEEAKPLKDSKLRTEVSNAIDRLRTSLGAAQRQLAEVQNTLSK